MTLLRYISLMGYPKVRQCAHWATLLLAFLAAALGGAQVPKEAVSGGIHPHDRNELTAFYDTPSPLPSGSPGSLIRAEEFAGYTLPPGIIAIRFLYHSRSSDGEDVPVSGVVLVPEENAPARGWPILAWAHGFDGVARDCAPSLRQNLVEGSFFAMYTKLGYAVVATDYAGLGTNTRAGYLNLSANSLDVIYSVSAARRAAPQLGARWLVAGYRDGGLVAAHIAEMETEGGGAGFLGSVAIGGLFDPEDIFTRMEGKDVGKILYLAYGIKAQASELNISEILTPQALKPYEDATKRCDLPREARNLTAAQLLRPKWETNPSVRRYFAKNIIGMKSAIEPLLVLASDSDSSMPVQRTTEIVQRLCGKGDRVLLYSYPTPNSQTLIGESITDQIAWVQGRFAGQAAPSNCH
jgi:alpha-beta hydrolase superfamily lysophospholipase